MKPQIINMKRIVYKILRKEGNRLYSLNYNFNKLLSQQYKWDIVNYPKFSNSRIFAFGIFSFARYRVNDEFCNIYKCIADVDDDISARVFGRLTCVIKITEGIINDFWKGNCNTCFTLDAPSGTVFCKNLRIIKKVTTDKIPVKF